MKPVVSIKKVDEYKIDDVKNAVIESLAPLGGIAAFVKPGQKVLIKPNLLAAMSPDKAVTTHPTVISAVVSIVKEAGGEVMLGDSPGIGDLDSVKKLTGVADIVEKYDIALADFSNEVIIECEDNLVVKTDSGYRIKNG